MAYAGIIEGTGSITKDGTGLMALSGNSTYTGDTNLTDGTLVIFRNTSIGASGTLNITNSPTLLLGNFSTMSHPIELSATTTLTISTADMPTISSVISETGPSGSIVKNGAGTLSLSGANTYTGLTTVNAGILALNGSVVNDVQVNNSATLQGAGVVGGNVHVLAGGTIKPGNSVGTLTVMGSLTLDSNSGTYIEINPTAASLIAVGGTASLAGQLTVFADSGTYVDDMTYTILSADGGLLGTMFDDVVFLGQDLGTVQVNYLANSVEFHLGLLPPPPPPPSKIDTNLLGNNPNAIHVAEYLNQFITDPILGPIVSDLSTLSATDLLAAMESISPARNAIAPFIAENTMFLIASTVSCRMAEMRLIMRGMQMHLESLLAAPFLSASNEPIQEDFSSTSGAGNRGFEKGASSETRSYPYGSTQTVARNENRYAVWAEGLGDFIRQDRESENPSYHSSTGGVLLGCDYYGGENGLLGSGLGFASSHIHQGEGAGKATIDFYTAVLYGTAYIQDGYIELGLAGALNKCSNPAQCAISWV